MRRNSKIKYLMGALLLLTTTWLGYWIGSISSTNSSKQSPSEAQGPIDPDNIAHFLDKNNNHVFVVKDSNQPNVPQNNIGEIIGHEHANSIHRAHAAKISNSINNNKEGNKKNKEKNLAEKILDIAQQHKQNLDVERLNRDGLEVPQEPPLEIPNNLKIENPQNGINNNVEHKQVIAPVNKKQDKNVPNEKEELIPLEIINIDDPYYHMIHSGLATRVHGQIHQHIKSFPENIPQGNYIFETNSLPVNPRHRPSIGNGNLATIVHSPQVFMNGLYNGRYNQSHRAVIPSTCSMNITHTEPRTNFTQTHRLNVAEGIYSEISKSKDGSYNLTQRVYAHRNITQLMVVEIDLMRYKPTPAGMSFVVELNKWTASYDITFVKGDSEMEDVSYKHGSINAPENSTNPEDYLEVHVVYDRVPDKLTPLKGSPRVKWVFLTAIGKTKTEAIDSYKEGRRLLQFNDQLYAQHVVAWADMWSRGRVDIFRNPQLAKSVYGSMYYTMSSLPYSYSSVKPFIGLSPSGLALGELAKDYQGHVMWDQETWMYPNILLFHPDLGKLLIDTRHRTSKAAADNAKKRNKKGIQYPWETALTGIDVTDEAKYSTYELHINGDIAVSILQYLYITNDTKIIEGEKYADLIAGLANFWVTTLVENLNTKQYEVHNVMPPDEDAGIVNNSVYTNEIARKTLAAPEYIFKLLNKTQTRWKPYADNMYIPLDKTLKYHPEFDGYVKGIAVKQADAVLLGYPLLRSMSDEIRRNDISFYESVTIETGPAMSWPMYAINWLELKEYEKAEAAFKKSEEYIQNEFQVWTEEKDGTGAANFITGMGGFLQSVIFGYGGFRIRNTSLDIDPVLPPGSTDMHFIGVDYIGNTMDIFISGSDLRVTVTKQDPGAQLLILYMLKAETVYTLALDKSVQVPVAKASILSSKLPYPNSI